MNKETSIIVGIGVAFFLLFFGFMWWSTQTANAPVVVDTQYLAKADSHMTGTLGAKVTMVEFGDFQCPACGQAHPLLKLVTAAYASSTNFNFVFKNFPLPQHPNAPEAAEAAEAAGAQGKYWQMHDMLYEHQNDWATSTDPLPQFTSYAQQLGLDTKKFAAEVTANTYTARITSDQADGNAISINHTPTVFLNGTEVTDLSFNNLKSRIDALIAK